jgi:nitroreductase
VAARTAGGDLLAALRARRSRASLAPPPPAGAELLDLLAAADCAPDHGRLRPWRYIVIEGQGRCLLGDAFGAAHAERAPDAPAAAVERSCGKPLRAPMIVVVVATPRDHPTIPVWEQRAAASCAAYGLLLAAHDRGFGAMWRTGWFGSAPKVRALLGLADAGRHPAESVTGWIYLGTPSGTAPPPRPEVPTSVTWLR